MFLFFLQYIISYNLIILGWFVFFSIEISFKAFSNDVFTIIFPFSSISIFFWDLRKDLSIIFKAYLTPSFSTNSILLKLPLPKYLINLASKEQLKNILSEENYVELIKQNEQELNQELSIPQIETYLDYYAVNGTELVLRDYQRNAVVKTDDIFENKKFASVVLPTGGGKSFVALTELMEHKDDKMLYLAPSNEILEQMKDYVIEYVHGLQGTLGKKSKEEIIAEVFPNITFETYPGLLAKKGKDVINQEYGFIVLDELHRTGASKWEGKLNRLLEKPKDSDILNLFAKQ